MDSNISQLALRDIDVLVLILSELLLEDSSFEVDRREHVLDNCLSILRFLEDFVSCLEVVFFGEERVNLLNALIKQLKLLFRCRCKQLLENQLDKSICRLEIRSDFRVELIVEDESLRCRILDLLLDLYHLNLDVALNLLED